MSSAVSKCEELVSRRCSASSAAPTTKQVLARGAARCPTGQRGAELTSGQLTIGSGFTAWLARCPGIGPRSALRSGLRRRRSPQRCRRPM